MRQRNGFTLLEMLVALVVMGLLLAGLTQGVQYGLMAWRTQVRVAGSEDDFAAVDAAVRHLIEVADPGNGFTAAPMAGSHNELEFLSTLPDPTGVRPAQPVSAALLVDAAHRLVLRWRPYRHVQALKPLLPPTDTELMADVDRLEFSFWGPAGPWTPSWSNAALPALIRIHLVFPAGDPRHWPDIIVAPLLDRP